MPPARRQPGRSARVFSPAPGHSPGRQLHGGDQVDSADPPLPVTDSLDAFNARYDARADAILTQVGHEAPPGNVYLTVGAMVRPAFGSTLQVVSRTQSIRGGRVQVVDP